MSLDDLLAKHTVFRSFAELLATRSDYIPTIDLRAVPELYAVAEALVNEGRDAYLGTRNGRRVFASELAFMAPEVIKAEYGIAVPTPNS